MFAVCGMLLASIASGPISPQRELTSANQFVQSEYPAPDMLMPFLIGYFDLPLNGEVPEYAERAVQSVPDGFTSDIEHPPSVRPMWLVTNSTNSRAKTTIVSLAIENPLRPFDVKSTALPDAIHRIDRTRFITKSQA